MWFYYYFQFPAVDQGHLPALDSNVVLLLQNKKADGPGRRDSLDSNVVLLLQQQRK